MKLKIERDDKNTVARPAKKTLGGVSVDTIKELTMQKIQDETGHAPEHSFKPKRGHLGQRIAAVAAAAVLVLTLGTGVLAALNVIDLNEVFNSIFYSQEAEPYVKSGKDITITGSGDIEIEPVAGMYDAARGGAYIKLRITVPQAARLTESLVFLKNGIPFSDGGVTVTLEDEHTAIVSMFSAADVFGGKIHLSFDAIALEITDYPEEQDTGFNIGENIGLTEPVPVPGAEFFELTELALNGETLVVSHRFTDTSAGAWGTAVLGVKIPTGDVMWPSTDGEYNTIDVLSGTITQSFELGSSDPNTLTLVWQGARAEKVLTGNWEIEISGDNPAHPRAIGGIFDGHEAQAVLGVTNIEFNVFADYLSNLFPFDCSAEGIVELTLADGTVVHPRFTSSMLDNTMANFSYDMEFVDPASVVNVKFCGVEFDNSLGS
ncbi:MAG: hypothetical protein LBO63_06495 [Oscillospiraceae bacterium]|jgi:hypothetical protein|nr:hypothetical protein [Oscillospiraceae bacterium]